MITIVDVQDSFQFYLQLHRSDKSMSKLLSSPCLPMEYGGTVPLREMGGEFHQSIDLPNLSLGIHEEPIFYQTADVI